VILENILENVMSSSNDSIFAVNRPVRAHGISRGVREKSVGKRPATVM